MSTELISFFYLVGAAAGLVGLLHVMLRPPAELQTRRRARIIMSVLMIPVTGVIAGGAALFYWARFLRP